MAKETVVKLAQPGYDALSAGDQNLIYSSLWPLLKIYKSGTFTTSDMSKSFQVIATHDLPYVPFFIFYSNCDIRAWDAATTPLGSANRSEFMGPTPGANIGMDTKGNLILDLFNGPNFPGSTIEIEYYIYALDITTNYQAPIVNSGSAQAGLNGDVVFKLAKDGKDTNSSELRDYVIHSDARSPLVHSVTAGVLSADASVPSGFSLTANHGLGYLPMFFGFKASDFDGYGSPLYYPLYTGNFALLGFNADEQKVQYFDFSAKTVSMVVLKDPFTTDYSVDVTI